MRRCISCSTTGGHTLRELQRVEKALRNLDSTLGVGPMRSRNSSIHCLPESSQIVTIRATVNPKSLDNSTGRPRRLCARFQHTRDAGSSRRQGCVAPLEHSHRSRSCPEWLAAGLSCVCWLQSWHHFAAFSWQPDISTSPVRHRLPVGDRSRAAAACCGDTVGLTVQGCPASAGL